MTLFPLMCFVKPGGEIYLGTNTQAKYFYQLKMQIMILQCKQDIIYTSNKDQVLIFHKIKCAGSVIGPLEFQ